MTHYLLHRLSHSLLLLLVMSFLVFLGVFALGNPLDLLVDPQADKQDIARMAAALGLDQPWWVQYGRFLRAALAGDLGNSLVHGTPAIQLILQRLPATLELALCALLLALVVGVPLGLWAGLRPDSWSGRLIGASSILGFSLPTFWVGLLLILVFAVHLGWLPASGRGPTGDWFGVPLSLLSVQGWPYLILPALNLALFKIALLIRLTSSATRDTLLQDYVLCARAKGLSPAQVMRRHVLKNILIPIITVLGLEFGALIAFAVVTETVFAWPGMGKLLIDSITALDRPVIVAYLLVTLLLFTLINLAVDVLVATLDPRLRTS